MEGACNVEESPALGQEDEEWREEMWSKQGHAGEELGARMVRDLAGPHEDWLLL